MHYVRYLDAAGGLEVVKQGDKGFFDFIVTSKTFH